jgi:hypothetical protein
VRVRVDGSPPPEVVAAVTACVQALMAGGPAPAPAEPAWRRAALAEGVHRWSPPPPGPAWAAPGPTS